MNVSDFIKNNIKTIAVILVVILVIFIVHQMYCSNNLENRVESFTPTKQDSKFDFIHSWIKNIY
jgi:predicted negative regulator of RcsB-dependent stress response